MFSTTTHIFAHQLESAFPQLLDRLEPTDVELLGKRCDRKLILAGRTLTADDRLPGLVLVLSGRMVPQMRPGAPNDHRWVVGPGDAVGFETLLGREPRHRALHALDSSEVRILDAAMWQTLRTEHPRVAVGFLQTLTRELASEFFAVTLSRAQAGA